MFFFLFLNLVYLTDKPKQDKIVLAIKVRCHIENGDFEKAKELSLKYFGFDIDKEGKHLQLEEQKRMIYDMAGKVIDASVKEMEEEFKIKSEQKEASGKKNKESANEESEKESVSDETSKFKNFLKNDKKTDSLKNSDDTKPLLKSSKKPTHCQEESTDSDEDTLSDLKSYEKASTLSARRKYINSSAFSSSSDTEKRFKKEKNYSKSETRRIQAHLKKLKLHSSPDIGPQKNCNGPINITKSFLRDNIIVSCGSAPCTCCLRTLQRIYLPEINESDDNTPSLSEERFAGGIPNKSYEKRQRSCSAASSADYCMFCNPKLNEKQCELPKKSEAKKLTKLPSVEEEDVEEFMEDPALKSKIQEEVIH